MLLSMREPQPAQWDYDASKGQPNGHESGYDGAEERHEDCQRHQDSEPFSLLQIFPGEFIRLVRDAGGSPQ